MFPITTRPPQRVRRNHGYDCDGRSKPFFATYDPNNGFVYVTTEGTTSNGTGSVTVINGTTVPRGGTIYVGPNPYFGLFDPRNGYVYIPCFGGHNVYVLYGC